MALVRAAVALAILALAGCSDRAYDAATEAIAAQLEAIPANAALRDAVEVRRAAPASDAPRAIGERLDALALVPLRVPGLYYESYRKSGADLSAVEKWLGRPVPLAPVAEVGTIADNAAVVALTIRGLAQDGRRVAIFSASKGTADVREALETEPDLAARVALWIDLAGVLEGTPLTEPGSVARAASADWLPEKTADSMAESARKLVNARRAFPNQVRVVHVAPFPRAGDVSEPVRRAWQILRVRGPNDGYVMLDGYARAPGRVLVLRGVDHFLRSPDLPPTVAAVLALLLDEIAPEGAPAGR
jgi:hypothetical protein